MKNQEPRHSRLPTYSEESRLSLSTETLEHKARRLVFEEVRTWNIDLDFSNVKIVWFSKTLKNWKAMVAVFANDNYYCEVTYNGTDKETYIDIYRKVDNIRIRD